MAGAHRSEDKLALTRSNSDGSSVNKSGSALGRRNSCGSAYGSATGSQFGSRTDMAEMCVSVPFLPDIRSTKGTLCTVRTTMLFQPTHLLRLITDTATTSRDLPVRTSICRGSLLVRSYNNENQWTLIVLSGFTNGGRYGEGYRNNY